MAKMSREETLQCWMSTSPRLDQIGAVFLDQTCASTLIVRTQSPKGELLVTSDDIAEIRKVLDRREAAGEDAQAR